MSFKFLLYIIVSIIVIWSMESVNINAIFKKSNKNNKVLKARLVYFFITISIIYMVTNFFYDFYLNY